MEGFTDKCLLLFPKPESYEYRSETYRLNFKKALNNLLTYLENKHIQPCCFTTDEIALTVNPRNVTWLQTLGDPDDFFMRNHNEIMAGLKYKTVEKLPDLYKKANAKVPLDKGLTTEQRFEVIVKREAMITKELINKYKLVIIFEQANNPSYKVVSKDADGRICIYIDNTSFIPRCYLSGMQVDANDLLCLLGANRPVFQWEV